MISVIVNFFNNRREAIRTLFSLSQEYQKFDDFEVIVIDNGSSEPLNGDFFQGLVESFGPQFQYRYIENASISPAAAINSAAVSAKGEHLLVMIDGAHILSPGVYQGMNKAFRLFDKVFVATTPFHIGPHMQNEAEFHGYNQQIEDQLLLTVDWKKNGYELFDISAECADMSKGWFGCLFESCCFGMKRSDYLMMGGMEERFVTPGGGMVNLDFFRRAVEDVSREYVVLLGEATFHQFHGGVATGSSWENHPWKVFSEEYQQIRGGPYFRVPRLPFHMGRLRKQSLRPNKKTGTHGMNLWEEEFLVRPQNVFEELK